MSRDSWRNCQSALKSLHRSIRGISALSQQTNESAALVAACLVSARDDVIPRMLSMPRRIRGEVGVVWEVVQNQRGLLWSDQAAWSIDVLARHIRTSPDAAFVSYEALEYLQSVVMLQLLAIALDASNNPFAVQPMIDKLALRASTLISGDPHRTAMSACRWADSFERDPAKLFLLMTSDTRRQYMVALDHVARSHRVNQQVLADQFLAEATELLHSLDVRDSHIGTPLSRRYDSLVNNMDWHCGSMSLRGRGAWYIFFVLAAALLAFVPLWLLLGVRHWWLAAVGMMLCAHATLPCVEILLGRIAGERLLPALDFSEGLPDGALTAIAVPILLTTRQQVDRALCILERNFLTANDSAVVAIVLADYVDADHQEVSPEEAGIALFLAERLAQLNQKYQRWGGHSFGSFTRPRTYSETQGKWMGRERKRGKIEEFIDAIGGESGQEWSLDYGADITRIRYLLVVDDDCLVERECIQRLVGVLQHPSNSCTDNTAQTGYGMVIPNTYTLKDTVSHWRLPSLMTGPLKPFGLPPSKTRNFLFDVFGRTHFPGKGLIDVRAFNRSTKGVVPNEMTLSHDTVEGGLIRCAYDGNASIGEGFPSTFARVMKRNHRWMRGDFQNIAVTQCVVKRFGNIFPITYWITLAKQLLSHLAPCLMTAMLVLICASAHACIGLLLLAMISSTSALYYAFARDPRCAPVSPLKQVWWRTKGNGVWWSALQAWHNLSSSLHQSVVAISAAYRAWRSLASRRGLLTWVPASVEESRVSGVPLGSWPATFCGLVGVALATHDRLNSALLIVSATWMTSPWVWVYISGRTNE